TQSGDAVRKATVRLQGNAYNAPAVTYVEISDATGKFAFEDLPPGRYIVSATRTGYTNPKNGAMTYSSIVLQPGEAKTGVDVRLVQLSVISGRVTDQDGDPAVGVQVQAMHVTYNNGRRQLTPYTTMTTDDQGNFRIANIDPGRY